MTKFPQPEKAEVVRFLLEKEGRVMVCLNAGATGVDVPRRFAKDEGLQLILNSNMPQPIDITDVGIESELRFGGFPHYCIIPFEAVWGVYNPDTGHGMFWPEAMTPSVRRNYESAQPPDPLPSGQKGVPGLDPEGDPPPEQPFTDQLQFKVIEGGAEGRPKGKKPPKKGGKSHLHLVDKD